MTTAAISSDQDSIVCEIDIAAPPERVFKALTDPAEARQWGNSPNFEFKIWEMDARRGGKWRFLCRETSGKANAYGVQELDHWGEIIEIDPPRLLVYTWITNFHDDPKRKTIVRWDLTPIPTGTRLKVTHSGLAQEPKARKDYAQGWPGFLEAVRNHAEKQARSATKAETSISPDQDAVVSEIQIAAPSDRVFQALIDPKQVMQWWTSEQCQIESFEFEPRIGGRWRYDTKKSAITVNGVTKFHCDGEVLAYDPPRELAYTWIANWHEDRAQRTVVRWELTPLGKGTSLKVTHSGLKKLPVARKDYSGGWPGVVEQLKNFVESQ
ncbi:MAG TPA: SRPBCC domain-containing protein [Terriglobales bacterium]|nr:SRPBCC domain-containing protein [Terriglobales bacterium]